MSSKFVLRNVAIANRVLSWSHKKTFLGTDAWEDEVPW